MAPMGKPRSSREVWRGQAVYNPLVLAAYDAVVMGGTLPFAWRCPVSNLIDLYYQYASRDHLECGVGTGYFTDHCRGFERLVLVDLNPNSLAVAARRLRRYRPTTYRRNVLERLGLPEEPFDSAGMNFLLHCLPGDIRSKAVAFDSVSEYVKPGGVVFGSTVLTVGVESNFLGRQVSALFNRTGIFCNRDDDLGGLRSELARRFSASDVKTIGSAALFWALK